jgi:DNA-binding beta-propeller fold protein YncE
MRINWTLSLIACVMQMAAVALGADADGQLATGLRLDPAGGSIDLGSMPLGMAIAPGGERAAIVLSGWREQGLQIANLKSHQVVQTLPQEAAFLGVAFSRDGKEIYASGGNADSLYCYSWKDGLAALEHRISLAAHKAGAPGMRYPAGMAASRRGDYLYVAENVSDTLAVVDPAAARVVDRFPTDHYPYTVEAAANGKVYVSAWGADTVSVFQAGPDGWLRPAGKLRVGPRPSALVTNTSGSRLFVALAGSDRVAIVDTDKERVLGYLSDPSPVGPSEGSTPNALALSADESKLFVAEADNNAVAVLDLSGRLEGRIPVDWYPTALVNTGSQLLVLCGKGHGSHANPDGPIPGEGIVRPHGYDLGQLSGTLRLLPSRVPQQDLAGYTRRVAEANNWNERRSPKAYPPFKHVIYIIKENRTYDQVFGDMAEGDGDTRLVFFGRAVSPNHHGLAQRFGLFDRFFTNAEVSSQGHIWSTAAYVTDFGEKTVPSAYSDRRQGVDGEEADEPLNGFLWTLARKKGIGFRDYGEMVKAPEGWPVTQRALGADVSPIYPAFNLKIADQVRADAWIAELNQFARDGKMPELEILHLPSDHTAGGRAGYPTPRAYMADNDLALGRIVEALSRSPFWRNTVVFVLEDDSQAGPDHVDCHRSVFLAISAYNRPGTVHRFINTTDVVAAIEDILGLGRLSKYDYFSRPLADIFATTPDPRPWTAIAAQADMHEINPSTTTVAYMSSELDLSGADRVNEMLFNVILWRMLKGDDAVPMAHQKAPLHLFQAGQ